MSDPNYNMHDYLVKKIEDKLKCGNVFLQEQHLTYITLTYVFSIRHSDEDIMMKYKHSYNLFVEHTPEFIIKDFLERIGNITFSRFVFK